MTTQQTRRSSTWGVAGCVALAALAAYWPVLRNGFTYDDIALIAENGRLGDLVRPAAYFSRAYFGIAHEATYRPLASLSYGLEFVAWGRSAFGSHLVNLLLHAGLSALLVPVCLSVGATRGVALAAGLLYATHPLRSEAVCGVGFREDLLCGLFCLGALALWPPLAEGAALGRPRQGARLSAALGLYVAALLSKEMALGLPPLLLLRDLRGAAWHASEWRSAMRGRAVWHAALWLLTAAALAFFLTFAGEHAAFEEATQAALWRRVTVFPWIVLRYVILFVWPRPLSVDHVVHPGAAGLWTAGLTSVVALAAFSALAWRGRRSFPAGRDAVVAFALLLAPVSNLIPLGHPMAERYLTLPMAPLCYLAAAALARVPRRAVRVSVLALVLAACVPLSWLRCRDWRSELTLWRSEVARGYASAGAYTNLGAALIRLDRYDGSIPWLLRAVALQPDSVQALTDLGCAYRMVGRPELAEEHLRRALAIRPDYAPAHGYLAAVLAAQDRKSDALAECAAALRSGSGTVSVRYNVGSVFLYVGEVDAAVEQFRAVLAQSPRYAPAYLGLVRALQRQGNHAEALEACRVGLRVAPPNVELLRRMVASCESLGRTDEARPALEQALVAARRDSNTEAAQEIERMLANLRGPRP